MNVSGFVGITVDLVGTKPIVSGVTASTKVQKSFLWSVNNGTGAGQADRLFVAERSVATAATDALDFSGSLLDMYGDPFVLARLKAFIIFNRPTNTTNLTVQRPSTATGVPMFAAVSDALAPITPGYGMLYMVGSAAGIVVTPATGDIVEIVNSAGGTAVYDLIVLGTSV